MAKKKQEKQKESEDETEGEKTGSYPVVALIKTNSHVHNEKSAVES